MNTKDKGLSDEILIARVASGDKDALEILYDQHAATVLGICLRIISDHLDVEEILQETFWRVWQSAITYQAQRGSFRSWLFRIARNLAIDTYRRQSVRLQAITEMTDTDLILDQLPDPNVDVSEQTQMSIHAQQLRNALASLPREQRQVIELAYFYGMTRQEIAEMTGAALGTIHTRARLGLKKLREEMESLEFEE